MEKFYILTFSYGSPNLDGPYPSRDHRDAAAVKLFNSDDFDSDAGDNIGYLDIDNEGTPTVGTYTDADLEQVVLMQKVLSDLYSRCKQFKENG